MQSIFITDLYPYSLSPFVKNVSQNLCPISCCYNGSSILDYQNGEIYAVPRTTPEYVVIGSN